MLNHMFAFVEKYPRIQDFLKKKFQFPIILKTFAKTKQKYWLIQLPLPDTSQLKINGLDLRVTGHHFTIPEGDDDQTQSQYHYTLELTQKSRKYRAHLYFDKLDHITVEPKLFDIADNEASPKFTKLDEQNIENIIDLCIPCTDLILFLREQQKRTLASCMGTLASCMVAKQANDDELYDLSTNLKEKKEQYIDVLKKQVQLMSDMEAIGCFVFSAQRRFLEQVGAESAKGRLSSSSRLYKKLIALLEQRRALAEGNEAEVLRLRIALIKHGARLNQFLAKKPQHKSRLFDFIGRLLSNKVNIVNLEDLRNNVEYLTSYLECNNQAMLFLEALTPKYMGLLKGAEDEPADPFVEMLPEDTTWSLPFDFLVRISIATMRNKTEMFKLYLEIIHASEPIKFSGGKLLFLSNNKRAKNFSARINAIIEEDARITQEMSDALQSSVLDDMFLDSNPIVAQFLMSLGSLNEGGQSNEDDTLKFDKLSRLT
ncbi:MAG: hypothetical protein ACHQJ6_05490 [Candidatus Berkiellales bacterium]